MRTRVALVLGLVAALALAGCDKVPKPTSDSTPPVLHWTVHNSNTGETKDFNGSATMQASVGHHFLVTLKADDPQGIHEITVGVSTGFTCVNGNLAQSSGPGLAPEQKQTLNPDSNGQVLTSIFLLNDVTMGPEPCSSGFTFASSTASFAGTGTNYFNGKTTATLTINAST